MKNALIIDFESNWGEISCDELGYICKINGDREIRGEHNYLFDIKRFDIVELQEYCDKHDIDIEYVGDILCVGFWKHDNSYTHPDYERRKEMFEL